MNKNNELQNFRGFETQTPPGTPLILSVADIPCQHVGNPRHQLTSMPSSKHYTDRSFFIRRV
jgi:hypothetical protein